MRKIAVLTLGLGLILPGTAQAQERPAGFYADISGMYTNLVDPDLTDATLPGELGVDNGFGISGTYGYEFGNGFRTEIEVSYRENGIKSISIAAFGLTGTGAASGDVTALASMLNGYFDIATESRWTPYIGAGVGVARIDVDISVADESASVDDTVFAFQGMAGLRYDLSEDVVIRAGYRYFGTDEPEFDTTEAEYGTHNVEVGLTYRF